MKNDVIRDMKEILFAIAKCAHHEDDALRFLEDYYDELLKALEAANEIEHLRAKLAERDAERRRILHNKRINDAVQTAFERGELAISGQGYVVLGSPGAHLG